MASQPLVAPRASTAQPDPSTTAKGQKSYQLEEEYSANQVNQEFDRIYAKLNAITVEAAAIANLATDLKTDGTETNANICIRLNAVATALNGALATLRQSSLLKSS